MSTARYGSAFSSDGNLDEAWLQAQNPVRWTTSNHARFAKVDGSPPRKGDLKATFTHFLGPTLPKRVDLREYAKTEQKMTKYFMETLDSLNSPQLTAVERLELLDFGRVGAVLFVARTAGKDPYITIGLNPMSTPVDRQDTDTYGAPTVSEFLDEALFPQFTNDPDTPGDNLLPALQAVPMKKAIVEDV
jgi:hypothetical protein